MTGLQAWWSGDNETCRDDENEQYAVHDCVMFPRFLISKMMLGLLQVFTTLNVLFTFRSTEKAKDE
jgi:hypothetical protein